MLFHFKGFKRHFAALKIRGFVFLMSRTGYRSCLRLIICFWGTRKKFFTTENKFSSPKNELSNVSKTYIDIGNVQKFELIKPLLANTFFRFIKVQRRPSYFGKGNGHRNRRHWRAWTWWHSEKNWLNYKKMLYLFTISCQITW